MERGGIVSNVQKVAVVTGAASGIGRGIAERLAEDGAKVVIADIDESTAEEVASSIGDNAVAVACNVTDEASVEGAVGLAVERFGRLDVMVNNAGILQISPVVETDVNDWDRMFNVNVRGMFLGCKAAAKRLIEQDEGGVIINAASGAGRHGVGMLSHYCATKACAISMTQSLALELAPHKIRVNAYAPGHIMTPMWDDIWEPYAQRVGKTVEEIKEIFLGTIPWGRFGEPSDVAPGISWLCTDDAAYITGQTIGINGGEWLH
jgi:acetoin reductase-like protein